LEHLKENIGRNLENKRYSVISQSLNKLVIKKERDQLFQHFDKIFLSIFPDFVEGFNALFNPEDHVQLTTQGAMNTDLRIFALIRMGIIENEKIAKILNFSINTIYSYKNRIKKRSIVPNNEFEERIMDIKSV
jgi:DNA-binding NarL/FixJ family response regulator